MIKMIGRMRKQDWVLFFTGMVFIAAQVGFSLKIPDYMQTITKLVETDGSSMNDIWMNGIWMLLCAGGAVGSAIAGSWFSVRLGSSFSKELRADIYQHVESYSMNEIDNFSTASLITRSTNDVTQIQNFMSKGLQHMVKAPFMVVWALIKIAGGYWQWELVTIIAVVIMTIMIVFLMTYAHPRLRKRQYYTDNLSRDLRENLTGIRVIRAYNAEKYQEAKFTADDKILTDNERKAHHGMSLMRPEISLVNNLMMVGIYVIGAYLIAAADTGSRLLIFSDMVVYSSYAAILIQAFMDMNMAFNMYPRAAVASERVLEVLNTNTIVKDGSSRLSEEAPKGTLEFDHVCFHYPGSREDILQDISFKVEKGKTLAIIGATGSGKSTIVNLIPRLYDAQSGRVLLDGKDVRSLTLKDLHDRVGYASQRAILLTGTVRSNVEYGDNGKVKTGEEGVRRAIRIAQAEKFVSEMDGGIDAEITRGGTNVSGGQKQRLSIARSIDWQPEVYVFDDSFSALDYQTDQQLRQALKKETAGITTVLVAQRIGTIRDADDIIVLDDGRIVGEGTHEQLMKNCQIYQEIAHTQLSAEELA